ncbi:MAG: hypothetical protein AAI978_00765 [Candidatus Hodgkinia cicadicola]
MWQGKRYSRKALVLVSGGIDSQFGSLVFRNRQIQTKCLNCVLHGKQLIQQLQVELANALFGYGQRSLIFACHSQFGYFVKLNARAGGCRSIAPCVNCNMYFKSAVCSLNAFGMPSTGHYVRLLITRSSTTGIGIINSINIAKSQLYFVSADAWSLFPIGFFYKRDVGHCHIRFSSKFSQSHDLCYERYRRRRASANTFGCGTPHNALRQKERAHIGCWGLSLPNTYIKTDSQTPLTRVLNIQSPAWQIRAFKTTCKLHAGQRVLFVQTSNRNCGATSSFFTLMYRFGALTRRLCANYNTVV